MTDIAIPDGFTRWDGGEQDGPEFEIILRTGHRQRGQAISWEWRHGADGPEHDIIAYRIVP